VIEKYFAKDWILRRAPKGWTVGTNRKKHKAKQLIVRELIILDRHTCLNGHGSVMMAVRSPKWCALPTPQRRGATESPSDEAKHTALLACGPLPKHGFGL